MNYKLCTHYIYTLCKSQIFLYLYKNLFMKIDVYIYSRSAKISYSAVALECSVPVYIIVDNDMLVPTVSLPLLI